MEKLVLRYGFVKVKYLAKRDLNPNIIAGGGKSDNEMQGIEEVVSVTGVVAEATEVIDERRWW